MPIPAPTKQTVAVFSGEPEASFKTYIEEASRKAVLMFRLGTCLSDLPEDELQRELATTALDELAYVFYLVRGNAKIMAKPFSSETIGSYSYQKLTQAVNDGKPTGLFWFDKAREELGVCDNGYVSGNSTKAFENDNFGGAYVANGELVGPADHDGWGGSFGGYGGRQP